MQSTNAAAITGEAVALRQSRPQAPALAVSCEVLVADLTRTRWWTGRGTGGCATEGAAAPGTLAEAPSVKPCLSLLIGCRPEPALAPDARVSDSVLHSPLGEAPLLLALRLRLMR